MPGSILALSAPDLIAWLAERGEAAYRAGQIRQWLFQGRVSRFDSSARPPSVAGWEWGAACINSATLLNRTNLILALLSDQDAALGQRCDPVKLTRKHGANKPGEGVGFLIDLLVQDAFEDHVRRKVVAAALSRARTNDDVQGALRQAATLILTSPEYLLA